MLITFVLAITSAVLPFAQPLGWPAVTSSQGIAEDVGPGVTYTRWQLQTAAGPLVVHETAIDLRDPDVAFDAALQNDSIGGSGETLSAMADRAQAEAAINADYFDINGSGDPLNALVKDGVVLHQPDGAAALIIGPGNAVSMAPMTFDAALTDAAGDRTDVTSVDDWVQGSTLSIVTHELGQATAGGANEIVLAPSQDAGTYRVVQVATALDKLVALAPGQLGVAYRPEHYPALAAHFAPGAEMELTFSTTPPLASITTAIGGGPLLVTGGKPYTDPAAPAAQENDVRYPVSGAGISSDGSTMWLVTVDGRAPSTSVGITRPMLASLFISLGAATAMAFDSGGSAEMVVRHAGDTAASVVNEPSDGRERLIADALLVKNIAPPGPPARMLLRADAPDVLAGSHVRIRAAAVDAAMQPAKLDPASLRFAVDSAAVASVDAGGTVTALHAGSAIVSVTYPPGLTAALPLQVVDRANSLAIEGYSRDVAVGATLPLIALAVGGDANPIAIDPQAVVWTCSGDGQIGIDGEFTAGSAPGVASIRATAAGAQAELGVLVGEHFEEIAASPQAGGGPGQWHASEPSRQTPAFVDGQYAPDGEAALHLAYDFRNGSGTRAAYAESSITLGGQPLALTLEAYGDGNGEWLRAGYQNADGIDDGVTLARHVDWVGWRTLRATIPPQARWPIMWTRIYAVEPDPSRRESGAMWFRELGTEDAGPQRGS